MTALRFHSIWRQWAALGMALGLWAALPARTSAEELCAEYARELLGQIPEGARPILKTDAALDHPEAFSLRAAGSRAEIAGGGPAGLLYGVQQWLASPKAVPTGAVEKPDFELRGTVLFLMKEASYDYQLTPTEFPWFFDRPLLTKYLDYLYANRINTIFLWSGNLFPSIVEMPEYPDAKSLTSAEMARNQEQFAWFTRECAKRNISVLLHFYSIHLPKALADSRKIPMHYNKPDEFAAKFMRYCLERFLRVFDSVGLYVCPGEVLSSRYTAQWIRDVIIPAAKASEKNPRIVVRYWGLDAEGFKKHCAPEYDNFYTELKHNVEMVVSPIPDARHASIIGTAKKHIVNLHEIADIKPFRWGSPSFVREMVGAWKKAGIDGAEVYGMVSWRWPYSLDRLEPQEEGFWPYGKKLITFERDAIWLEAIGRYLWKVDRPQAEEEAFWKAKLAEKFGNAEAGELFLKWYDTTGPVLPGLQNLTHVKNMNFYPTAVGKEQMVDAILDTKKCDADYPARPFDAQSFSRYKEKYGLPGLTDRMAMPVAEFAEKMAAGQTVTDAMTPDKLVDLFVAMAEEGLALAEKGQAAASKNRDEAARFVTDSQALVLVTQAWREKVLAAIAKRAYQQTGAEKYADELREHLRKSIEIYLKLIALTELTYVNPTDMLMNLNWRNGLRAFRIDMSLQLEFLDKEKAKKEAAK
ncbi:MAG: hypothetical protein IT426_12340 [Pirellulales bacterium]|nr:hypothetical protein [Pirellulales bacterium]